MEANIGRRTAYEHRDSDATFAARWDEALDFAADLLVAEARRRAHDGVNEPVIHEGRLCLVGVDKDNNPCDPESEDAIGTVPLTIKRYSDGLLQFLLKGAKPEVYREKYHHTHAGKIGLQSAADGEAEADAILDELRKRLGDAAVGAPADPDPA